MINLLNKFDYDVSLVAKNFGLSSKELKGYEVDLVDKSTWLGSWHSSYNSWITKLRGFDLCNLWYRIDTMIVSLSLIFLKPEICINVMI